MHEPLGIARPAQPPRPAIPAPAYTPRDGRTAKLRALEVGGTVDFARADANRVRVTAQRLAPKVFCTRTVIGPKGGVLRVWRLV